MQIFAIPCVSLKCQHYQLCLITEKLVSGCRSRAHYFENENLTCNKFRICEGDGFEIQWTDQVEKDEPRIIFALDSDKRLITLTIHFIICSDPTSYVDIKCGKQIGKSITNKCSLLFVLISSVILIL